MEIRDENIIVDLKGETDYNPARYPQLYKYGIQHWQERKR